MCEIALPSVRDLQSLQGGAFPAQVRQRKAKGMGSSKLQMLAQGVTLAMVAALAQYAQETQAGTFTDSELHDLLARFGGSMVQALGYLSSLGEQRQAQA